MGHSELDIISLRRKDMHRVCLLLFILPRRLLITFSCNCNLFSFRARVGLGLGHLLLLPVHIPKSKTLNRLEHAHMCALSVLLCARGDRGGVPTVITFSLPALYRALALAQAQAHALCLCLAGFCVCPWSAHH